MYCEIGGITLKMELAGLLADSLDCKLFGDE